jgi:glycerophosphoryl diester phosphodiesterase
VSEFFSPARPRVFAHRGFAAPGSGVVENTLPAFAAALALGASHVETDVHATRDGIAVISHDPDLERVAGASGRVSDRTLAELQRVPLGSATFPSLAEALAAFPTARFNIDVKSEDAVEPTARAIQDAGAAGRVLVTSFSEQRRMGVVRRVPGVATSASAGRFARALVAGKLGLESVVRRELGAVGAVQVPEKALGLAVATPRFLAMLHDIGVEMHVWTINDAHTMHALLDRGVDGIVTDRTDLAISVIAERAAPLHPL